MKPDHRQVVLPMQNFLLALGLTAVLVAPCAADNRNWTLADGSTIVAELEELSPTGDVTLRLQNGDEQHLLMSDLSPSDAAFIRDTGGRSTLPPVPVQQRDIRLFLGFPLGTLRVEVRRALKGRLVFGSDIAELTPDDWANERIWVGNINDSRELWATQGNQKLAKADMTSLAFRKGRLAHVLVRIPLEPAESEKSILFQQVRSKLEQLYGLMNPIELGDDVAEAWQVKVGNVHIGLLRRTQPSTVLVISGSYLPLTAGAIDRN